jgi:hypothetical protein
MTNECKGFFTALCTNCFGSGKEVPIEIWCPSPKAVRKAALPLGRGCGVIGKGRDLRDSEKSSKLFSVFFVSVIYPLR